MLFGGGISVEYDLYFYCVCMCVCIHTRTYTHIPYFITYKAYFQRVNFVKKSWLEHTIGDYFDFVGFHWFWTEDLYMFKQ